MTTDDENNPLISVLRDVKYVHKPFLYTRQPTRDEARGIEGTDEDSAKIKPSSAKKSSPPDYWVIGTISRELSFNKTQDPGNCDLVFSEEDGQFRHSLDFDFKARRKRILDEICAIANARDAFIENKNKNAGLSSNDRNALKANLIIVFGEFDYPCFIQGKASGNMSDQDNFWQELQCASNTHNCIILAGSYHQVVNGEPRNTSLLFHPGKSEPNRHLKWRPAQKLGEKVLHPDNNELRFYHTSLGTFGVFVCMDVFDINLVSSMAQRKLSSEHLSVDFLLVPSFVPSENGNRFSVNACQNIAYLTRTTVVYVNSASYADTDDPKFDDSIGRQGAHDYNVKHYVVCPGETLVEYPETFEKTNADGTTTTAETRERLHLKQVDGMASNMCVVALDQKYKEETAKETQKNYSKTLTELLLNITTVPKGF